MRQNVSRGDVFFLIAIFSVARKVAQHSHKKERKILNVCYDERPLCPSLCCLGKKSKSDRLQSRKSSPWPLSCPWKIWWVMPPVLLRSQRNKQCYLSDTANEKKNVFVSNTFIHFEFSINKYVQIQVTSALVPAKFKQTRKIG